MPPPPRQVTQLLVAWGDGDKAALDELMPLVQGELRRLAHRHIRRERPGHTLQTSALVNEAYLRLVAQKNIHWQGRAHFFGIAARLMRQILVDYARSRNYAKRGGGARRVSLEQGLIVSEERAAEVVALDEALESLEKIDPRKCRVVEMRYFWGLSIEETAQALEVSEGTVRGDWTLAKAWLHKALKS